MRVILSWIVRLFSWIKRLITGESPHDKRFTREMRRKLQEAFKSHPETGHVSVMTYASAIEYFVTDRPDNEAVVRGAILRQRPEGEEQAKISLVQAFLDEDFNIISGRKVVVDRLDEELRKAFGDRDLIIVE